MEVSLIYLQQLYAVHYIPLKNMARKVIFLTGSIVLSSTSLVQGVKLQGHYYSVDSNRQNKFESTLMTFPPRSSHAATARPLQILVIICIRRACE